jgi:predicted MFS family arabinose efflux permease
VRQQQRLINKAPTAAPVLLGLNSAAISIGVSMSGGIGGVADTRFDCPIFGLVGAAFLTVSLLVAEWAHRSIAQPDRRAAEAVTAP